MARYAAQAVTDEAFGDFEIVVQEIEHEPNDWPTGVPVANLPLDGDFTAEADLDHALDGANFTRVSPWEPTNWGWIATVEKKHQTPPPPLSTPDPWAPKGGYPAVDLF